MLSSPEITSIAGQYIERTSFGVDLNGVELQLQDSVFDCSVLPSCDITGLSDHTWRN